MTTTYGPAGIAITHGGAVISMLDQFGNLIVVSCARDTTIAVTPLRTAPDPATIYSGTSSVDAGSAVVAQLETDGAAA